MNGVPFPITNAGPANATDYFVYNVSTNAVGVRFEVNNPTANVTLVARKGLPLPSLTQFDFLSANPGNSDELIVVTPTNTPPLTPGDWFLGVVNLGGGQVSYSARATELLPGTTHVVITNTVVTRYARYLPASTAPRGIGRTNR